MKKSLAMLLVVALLLALALPAFAEDTTLEDYDDVMVITGYFETGPAFGNDNLQHKWLLENLKIDIQGQFASGGDTANKLSLMVANDDMPDVVYVGNGAGYRPILQEFVDSGMVAAADDYFDLLPNFLKYRNEDIINYWSNEDDSKLYMLPGFVKPAEYVDELGLGDPMVLGIREDVIRETGLEVPTTIDEFYNFLVKSKEVLSERGGIYEGFIPFGMMYCDTWDAGNAQLLPKAFGMDPGGVTADDANGMMIESFMSTQWAEAHKFMAKLYREGLLDQEVITGDHATLQEKGKQGKYGILWTSISVFGDNIEGAIERLGIEDKYICMELPHIDSIEKTNWLYFNQLGSSLGMVNINAENKERIFQYIDWQNTPLGNMITWWGGPDEEESWFYVNEDGTVTKHIENADKILRGEMTTEYISPWTYWIAGLGVTIPSDFNDENSICVNAPGVRSFHRAAKDIGFAQAYNDPMLDPYFMATRGPEYDACWTDITAIVNKYRAELIMRTEDDAQFDTVLQTMYAELENAGLSRVAAENYELYKSVNGL